MALKCKAMINLYKFVNETFAPCYSCFWVQYHSKSLEHYKHWFCFDDLSHCVKGTGKFVVVRHVIPTIWPIQEGINLTQKEVTSLEEAWFFFDCLHRNNAQIYLVSNLLFQVIPMCMRWAIIALWGHSIQVVGLQLVVARRWNDLLFSKWHNNTPTIGRLAFYFSNALFSPLWMFHHLGMDELTIFFLMTNDMTSPLEISLVVHVSILLQCWQLLWVAMGHMCNANMYITSFKWFMFCGFTEDLIHGVGMKFKTFVNELKNLWWSTPKLL
jgi:hypothetical protein